MSRGVCEVSKEGDLVSIHERTKIYKDENNKIQYEDNDGKKHEVPFDSSVSMNFWCFHPTVYDVTEKLFHDFVKDNYTNIKSEFFIPLLAEDFIENQNGVIKVIPTTAQWFGVTYKEDKPIVQKCISDLVASGAYPENLWP